jgi:predicted TIM-barrel fold metal-dependent hydrolase
VRITDAQVHIWRTVKQGYDPALVHRHVPFTAEDLIAEMDAAGVTRAVIIPPGWGGLGPDGNEYAVASAHKYPDRLGVVGFLNFDAADAREQILSARERGMLGMRLVFMPHLFRAHLDDGRASWVWEAAESIDLPLMVAGAVDQLDLILAKHPRVRIATQMGWPVGAPDSEIRSRTARITALAKYPNLVVKAKMLPNFVPEQMYPYRRAHESFCSVLAQFGPDRVFWGSDLTHLVCTYSQLVTMFTEEMPCLDPQTSALVMGESLSKWLNWQ